MRGSIMAGLISTLVLTGVPTLSASVAQATQQDDGYNAWLIAMSKAASADRKYKRIPLNTEAQTRDFMDLTYQLYSKRMTADQYRAAVLSQYPGHDYEVSFIIAQLP